MIRDVSAGSIRTMSTVNKKDLEKMTVVQLKEELVARGLADNGKKAELVERLFESKKADELLNQTELSDAAADALLNEDALLGEGEDLEATEPVEPTPAVVSPKKDGEAAAVEEKKEEAAKEAVDPKLARAARFGLPVSSPAVTGDDVKAKRAARFGMESVPPSAGVADDAKAKRAARFGIDNKNTASPVPAAPAPKMDDATKEKLKARAMRFGLPVNAEGKVMATGGADTDTLAKRAARFNIGAGDAELDEKKKARLARFGGQAV